MDQKSDDIQSSYSRFAMLKEDKVHTPRGLDVVYGYPESGSYFERVVVTQFQLFVEISESIFVLYKATLHVYP